MCPQKSGTASARRESQWSGQVHLLKLVRVIYRIPRTDLIKMKNTEDLKQAGVYLLLSNDDEDDQPEVYVGQAQQRKNGNGVLGKILEHLGDETVGEEDAEDKERIFYWTQALVLVTSNDAFGPTEISYLENIFHQLATDAGRYRIRNRNDPSPGTRAEGKLAELNVFVHHAQLVLGALGNKVFEPLDDRSGQTATAEPAVHSDAEPILYRKSAGACGTGRQTGDGFVVFKESLIKEVPTDSCPDSTRRDRAEFADTIGGDHRLSRDILLTSPSRAARFLTGSSINGMQIWKDGDDKTLSELEESNSHLLNV